MSKGRSGIYTITNKESDKVYIGSTAYFAGRWAYHRSRLRRSIHDNSYLQNAWNKYGEKTFRFEILEHLDDLDELHLAEQFWMDVYREEGRELYNIGECAYNALRGRKRGSPSEEARQRMSVNGRGENSGVSKLTENQVLWIRALVKEGMLQKDVGSLLGVSVSTVSAIIRRKRWIWL